MKSISTKCISIIFVVKLIKEKVCLFELIAGICSKILTKNEIFVFYCWHKKMKSFVFNYVAVTTTEERNYFQTSGKWNWRSRSKKKNSVNCLA